MLPPMLHLVGPGRLGMSLTGLWLDAGLIQPGCVVGREGTDYAVPGGFQRATPSQLPPAPLVLLATPDDTLFTMAETLAAQGLIAPGTVVFHCSGASSSALLAPLQATGAHVASVHPLRSFAARQIDPATFAGTWCGCEGDAEALAVLEPLFTGIGGRCFRLDSPQKLLYHAGAVFASNYLVALAEAAHRCLQGAGVAPDKVLPVLQPLMQGTLDNILRNGTAAALTGPIARGDAGLVAAQWQHLHGHDPQLAGLYQSLGHMTLALTRHDDAHTAALQQALLQGIEAP